jgi:hypothetical protein
VNKAMLSRILVVLFAALSGCGGGTDSLEAAPTGVVVALSPGATNLDACQTVRFSAAVTGTASPGVLWSIVEGPSGGTIDSGGVYTAPSSAGTYHVVATSSADGTKSVVGSVAVGPEKVLSVAVTPGSASVALSGTLAFSALVTTSCGTYAAQ